jgi:hypothetical protein
MFALVVLSFLFLFICSLNGMKASVDRMLKFEKETYDVEQPVGYTAFMPHQIIGTPLLLFRFLSPLYPLISF